MSEPSPLAGPPLPPVVPPSSLSAERHRALVCEPVCHDCGRAIRERWARYHSVVETADFCLGCGNRRVLASTGLVFVHRGLDPARLIRKIPEERPPTSGSDR